jgi:hypothetical protein
LPHLIPSKLVVLALKAKKHLQLLAVLHGQHQQVFTQFPYFVLAVEVVVVLRLLPPLEAVIHISTAVQL